MMKCKKKKWFHVDNCFCKTVQTGNFSRLIYDLKVKTFYPKVNQMTKRVFFRFAAALQEAAQVDKLIEEETGGEEVLEDRLPLLGVPLSVKESFSLQGNYYHTSTPILLQQACPSTGSLSKCPPPAPRPAGMPLTTGLMSRRGVVASVDAPPVALLKRAGAVPLGVTNTSELCMWLESHNHLYGVTRNAYDLERIPGGSSGQQLS